MDDTHQSTAEVDQHNETGKAIEAFAQLMIDYAEWAVKDGAITADIVPEALLLAAVELAARQDGEPEAVADWLAKVADDLRVRPEISSI